MQPRTRPNQTLASCPLQCEKPGASRLCGPAESQSSVQQDMPRSSMIMMNRFHCSALLGPCINSSSISHICPLVAQGGASALCAAALYITRAASGQCAASSQRSADTPVRRGCRERDIDLGYCCCRPGTPGCSLGCQGAPRCTPVVSSPCSPLSPPHALRPHPAYKFCCCGDIARSKAAVCRHAGDVLDRPRAGVRCHKFVPCSSCGPDQQAIAGRRPRH